MLNVAMPSVTYAEYYKYAQYANISTMTLVGIGCLCWMLLCRVSLMLSIANMPSMLSVIMLNVSLLFVAAPYIFCC
jgi:hypothetical protein